VGGGQKWLQLDMGEKPWKAYEKKNMERIQTSAREARLSLLCNLAGSSCKEGRKEGTVEQRKGI